FTKLTIGDGLVSQVPAFLISLAAGLIVTRSSSESDLGREVTAQLFGRREVLGVAAVFLVLLSFTALPRGPLLTLAAALGLGALGRGIRPAAAEDPTDEAAETGAGASTGKATTTTAVARGSEPSASAPASERMEDLLHVDP